MAKRPPSGRGPVSRWRELCQRPFIQAAIAIRDVATVHKTLDQIGPNGRPKPASDNGAERDTCGFALQHESGEAYNEEAFQYFLEIERKRAEIANRPFLLMLIELHKHPAGHTPDIDLATASKLFAVLQACLRETDFIGWYRDRRIAGAVLTQHAEPNREDLAGTVRQRVSDELEKIFPSDRPGSFQVRVYELSPCQA